MLFLDPATPPPLATAFLNRAKITCRKLFDVAVAFTCSRPSSSVHNWWPVVVIDLLVTNKLGATLINAVAGGSCWTALQKAHRIKSHIDGADRYHIPLEMRV